MNEGNNSPLYYSVIMASSTANITVSVGSGI
jgi:hypothetical protein